MTQCACNYTSSHYTLWFCMHTRATIILDTGTVEGRARETVEGVAWTGVEVATIGMGLVSIGAVSKLVGVGGCITEKSTWSCSLIVKPSGSIFSSHS